LILAVIQARIDSSRLPGKVLFDILGESTIWRIYERLKFCKYIDRICISTSNEPSDDLIADLAKEKKIDIFRGSQENLVSRHLSAAKKFNADVIVRITADCPFVDPMIIDKLILMYKKNQNIDFFSNTFPRTYPTGLDVELIPIKTLEKLLPISENEEFFEYFISLYIYEHFEEFTHKGLTYEGLKLEDPNSFRWTMDYEEDYTLVKEVFSALYNSEKPFLMKDILSLIEKNPHLATINSMHNLQASHLKYEKDEGRKINRG
jgi:spore coat polysaccharide biosynthesis protein SpsF